MMDDNGGWITPSEAISALSKIYGSRSLAKDAIADLLLDGEMEAVADRSWYSDIFYLNDAWRSRRDGNIEFEQNVQLTARDWMASEDWFNDLARWRWMKGRFVISHTENPREWRFLEGIRFASSGVSRAIDLAVGAVSRSKGGPNADIQRWARFWLAVVSLAQAGELTRTRIRSKARLYDKIRERDPTTVLGRRSVDDWLDIIWDDFIQTS